MEAVVSKEEPARRPRKLFYRSTKTNDHNIQGLHNRLDHNSNVYGLTMTQQVEGGLDPKRVELPERFKAGSGVRSISDEVPETTSRPATSRPPPHRRQNHHQDVSTALQWIRQEIEGLKETDRALMRQLLGLRATIHQLQGSARSCPSLASSSISTSLSLVPWSSFATSLSLVSHPSSSFATSLDDNTTKDGPISAPCTDRGALMTYADIMQDFYSRTVSMQNIHEHRMIDHEPRMETEERVEEQKSEEDEHTPIQRHIWEDDRAPKDN